MTVRSVTIEIPEALYERLQQRAARAARTMQAEVLDALAAAVNDEDADLLPTELVTKLSDLDDLDDAALWDAARSHLLADAVMDMEALHLKQQETGLSADERDRLADLLRSFEQVMVVRAHAAMQLKQRGYDVQELVGSA